VLGGLLILTRPEGVLLLALAAMVVAARSAHGGLKELIGLAAAALLTLAPGAGFNLQAGGALFPNTFYAKQAEYAVLTSTPGLWLGAIGQMLAAPLAGAGAVLLPGLAAWIVAQRRTLRSRTAWDKWMPLVWAAGHLGAYALRLPVHYQHGRYLLPLIPIVVLYGAAGLAMLSARGRGRTAQLAGRVLGLAAGVVVIAFLPLGASAYAADTAVIDGEMVAAAQWLHVHTPSDALVAAHDIGALGYFAGRPLLDMAGLISPEVVPFIRDEDRLWAWVQTRGAQYVIAFPDWYPQLTARPELSAVFEGRTAASPSHLTVYAVK